MWEIFGIYTRGEAVVGVVGPFAFVATINIYVHALQTYVQASTTTHTYPHVDVVCRRNHNFPTNYVTAFVLTTVIGNSSIDLKTRLFAFYSEVMNEIMSKRVDGAWGI